MKLLITHFFNEEYLLPWWLIHHREIFDHGILIDYHSTDRSVEICRDLVPTWEIIRSENANFGALTCDFEVMKHEARYPDDWKIVLNVTEFLVGNDIDKIIHRAETDGHLGLWIPGAAMVDDKPTQHPDPHKPLVEQKIHGFWESEFPKDTFRYPWFVAGQRTRLLHRYCFGAYTPGRHSSFLPDVSIIPNTELGIWWYGFSPSTPDFLARKTQIQTRMDPLDRKIGFGIQHLADQRDIDGRRETLLRFSHEMTVPGGSWNGRQSSSDYLVQARNLALSEQEKAVHSRDQAVHSRDQAMHARDQAMHARDQAMHARDQAIHERDEAVRIKKHVQRYPWKYILAALRSRLHGRRAQRF